MEETIFYHSHPPMFENRPFAFILCLILSLVGVGLIIFWFGGVRQRGQSLRWPMNAYR